MATSIQSEVKVAMKQNDDVSEKGSSPSVKAKGHVPNADQG
jgi:hypothetical protein